MPPPDFKWILNWEWPADEARKNILLVLNQWDQKQDELRRTSSLNDLQFCWQMNQILWLWSVWSYPGRPPSDRESYPDKTYPVHTINGMSIYKKCLTQQHHHALYVDFHRSLTMSVVWHSAKISEIGNYVQPHTCTQHSCKYLYNSLVSLCPCNGQRKAVVVVPWSHAPWEPDRGHRKIWREKKKWGLEVKWSIITTFC